MFRNRLTRALAAASAVAAVLVPLGTLGSTPAQAAPACSGNLCPGLPIQCFDFAKPNPTNVRSLPSDGSNSPIIAQLSPNTAVTGDCRYYNNTSEGRWYMEIIRSNGGYGYIWVQELKYGSDHNCFVSNSLDLQPIGSSASCPLQNY
jgi:hypothetical protein